MSRRVLLAPAVIGGIVAVEVIRRGAWLAWPIFTTARALCQRPKPNDRTELDYPFV